MNKVIKFEVEAEVGPHQMGYMIIEAKNEKEAIKIFKKSYRMHMNIRATKLEEEV